MQQKPSKLLAKKPRFDAESIDWSVERDTFQNSNDQSRYMTIPANDGMSSQTKISANFEGFDTT